MTVLLKEVRYGLWHRHYSTVLVIMALEGSRYRSFCLKEVVTVCVTDNI